MLTVEAVGGKLVGMVRTGRVIVRGEVYRVVMGADNRDYLFVGDDNKAVPITGVPQPCLDGFTITTDFHYDNRGPHYDEVADAKRIVIPIQDSSVSFFIQGSSNRIGRCVFFFRWTVTRLSSI